MENQVYCSNLCFTKRNQKTRECVVCGKRFLPPSLKTRCCSLTCSKIKGGNTLRKYKDGGLQQNVSKAITDSIYGSLKRRGIAKNRRKNGTSWQIILGYTQDDLWAHLEKKFKPGMTWDNFGRGGWHIDHIIPVSAHNFTSIKHADFHKCWALSNLQPLWEFENCSKHDRLEKPFQPSLAM